ncbi:MAG: LCP family protein [Candidatus Saccharimonadales bacterium]
MDFEKHRPRRIDGFSAPRKPRRSAVFKDSNLSVFKSASELEPIKRATLKQTTSKPKAPPSYAYPQLSQPTLIGMTLPKAQVRPNNRGKVKKRWSRRRKVVLSMLTIIIILFGWFGSRIIGSLDKVFHGNLFSDAQALFSHNQLKGESSGRVNILVAGDSVGDPGHGGAVLTDSIMVLSIDTKNHSAFLLSIPRDLWVYIPGLNSYQKINATNDVTNFNQAGYPKGGMGQLEQVVQTDLGIPIDYYTLVNYTAFKDAVNAVGGISIKINSPDPRGLYDAYTNLKLPNGNDTLNGQQALDLARARGDGAAGDVYYGFPNSDFTRTMYQREMATAIAKKATSIGVVSNPLKINSLFSSFANNVQTDLNLQNVLTLAQLTKGLNLNNIGSYQYSNSLSGDPNPLLVDYQDPASGQDALIPADGIGNYAGLKGYYQQLVSTNPIAKEDASVELLNSTNVNGLAANEQKVLQSKAIVNVSIADASNNYPTSMIVDNSGGKDPATKALLQQMFPGSVVTTDTGSIEAGEASLYKDTFVVIIGQNFANANPTASNSSPTTSGSYTGSSTN